MAQNEGSEERWGCRVRRHITSQPTNQPYCYNLIAFRLHFRSESIGHIQSNQRVGWSSWLYGRYGPTLKRNRHATERYFAWMLVDQHTVCWWNSMNFKDCYNKFELGVLYRSVPFGRSPWCAPVILNSSTFCVLCQNRWLEAKIARDSAAWNILYWLWNVNVRSKTKTRAHQAQWLLIQASSSQA